MKLFICSLLLALGSVFTCQADDLVSPKPGANQPIRILLHLAGSERMIDYADVAKVLCSEPAKVVFETHDGHVVVHQGSYTVVQQKISFNEHRSRGVRFFDAK